MSAARRVRTVGGDLDALQLGPTSFHEHLLFSPLARDDLDLQIDDEDRAAADLEEFRTSGGSGIVDATVSELGRDAEGVARLARRTGIEVVLACGHTSQEWWGTSQSLESRSVPDLADEMITELTIGVGTSGVRAGVIKVGTSLNEITPAERRMIRAAAVAQQAVGAPIITHTTEGTAGMDQVRELDAAGADLSRVCVGHLDRRLDWEVHSEIALTGVFLGFDQISKERHQPDQERARFISRLVAEGFGAQVLLGCDLARRNDLTSWGGSPGRGYLMRGFVRLLGHMGVADEAVTSLLVDNPRRFLAWVKTEKPSDLSAIG